MNGLLVTITYIILFIWIVFPPEIERPLQPQVMNQDDNKIITNLKERLKSIKEEKYSLGQSIVNGIWNAKSKEARTFLADMLVELLSSFGV